MVDNDHSQAAQTVTLLKNKICRFIESLSLPATLWLAYSGGVDSHVLLHLLSSLRCDFPNITIAAIHIHHGWHVDADSWANHCRRTCRLLNIDCHISNIDIKVSHQGKEAAAREARYNVFSALLPPEHYLITAHHQEDQAETFLLQLLRGAGPKGLAAMPLLTTFAKGYLARPLLDNTRDDILRYAYYYRLSWIEDDSNQSLLFDRNFLRHKVLPLLKQRRSQVSRAIARSARLCAEASELVAALGQIDWQRVKVNSGFDLSAKRLKTLSLSRQRNVIRYWLQQHDILLPSAVRLSHIVNDVVFSRYDANPCVSWHQVSVRRKGDTIFFVKLG